MKCQNCGKNEANIRYTEIINGSKREIALCSSCAKEIGMDSFEVPDFPLNFHSILGDFFNDYAENTFLPSFQNQAIKCKTCGTTYDDFINTGMFGCSDCYDTFSSPIESLLKNLHGTSRHVGRGLNSKLDAVKVEGKSSSQAREDSKKDSDKNNDLQKQLEKAISEERYEDAAKIRDEIKKNQKKSES